MSPQVVFMYSTSRQLCNRSVVRNFTCVLSSEAALQQVYVQRVCLCTVLPGDYGHGLCQQAVSIYCTTKCFCNMCVSRCFVFIQHNQAALNSVHVQMLSLCNIKPGGSKMVYVYRMCLCTVHSQVALQQVHGQRLYLYTIQ